MFCAKLSLYHVHDKLRLSSLLNDLLNWQTTIWHLHDTLLEIFNNIQFKCDVHPSNKSMFFPETKSWKTPKQSGTWLEYLGKLWLLTIKELGLKSGLIAMFKITIRLLFLWLLLSFILPQVPGNHRNPRIWENIWALFFVGSNLRSSKF